MGNKLSMFVIIAAPLHNYSFGRKAKISYIITALGRKMKASFPFPPSLAIINFYFPSSLIIMKNLLNFFIEVGKLKGKKRRGWIVHQIKNSESTADHIFRMVLIAWILGRKKKLNLERVIKMALVHDLCEVYSPDVTPYDPLLPKNSKKIMEVLKKWPKFTPTLKIKKYKEKYKLELWGLDKLTSRITPNLRAEIKNLWLDYEKGLTKEGRFVKQVDKIENLLQGLEYWEKYGKIQHKLWMRWIKEIINDPVLLEFVRVLEKKFYKKYRHK